MTAGNDFCNNELFNARTHNVDEAAVDDDGRIIMRGLPAPGRELYVGVTEGDWAGVAGTRIVCTDTAPDSAYDGGGTYSRYQFGDDFGTVVGSASASQGTGVAGATSSYGRVLYYARSASYESGFLVATFAFTVSVGGTAATAVSAALNPATPWTALYLNWSASGGETPDVGGYTYWRSAAVISTGRVAGASYVMSPSSPATLFFYQYDGADLASVVTMTSGDVLTCSVQFPYSLAP